MCSVLIINCQLVLRVRHPPFRCYLDIQEVSYTVSINRDAKLVHRRVIGPGFPTIKSNVNRYLYCAVALFTRRACKHFKIDSCRKDPRYSSSSGLTEHNEDVSLSWKNENDATTTLFRLSLFFGSALINIPSLLLFALALSRYIFFYTVTLNFLILFKRSRRYFHQ